MLQDGLDVPAATRTRTRVLGRRQVTIVVTVNVTDVTVATSATTDPTSSTSTSYYSPPPVTTTTSTTPTTTASLSETCVRSRNHLATSCLSRFHRPSSTTLSATSCPSCSFFSISSSTSTLQSAVITSSAPTLSTASPSQPEPPSASSTSSRGYERLPSMTSTASASSPSSMSTNPTSISVETTPRTSTTPTSSPPMSTNTNINTGMSTSTTRGTGGVDNISTSTTPPSTTPPPSTPTTSSNNPPPTSSTPIVTPTSSSTNAPGGLDGLTTTSTAAPLSGSTSSVVAIPTSSSNSPLQGSSTASPIAPSASTSYIYSVPPSTILSTAVSFTTTNSVGSPIVTIPPEFTTVIVTVMPGGSFTSMTEVVANPPGVLNPGDNDRSSSDFFMNKGAVAGVFIAAAIAALAIIAFIVFAFRRRRKRIQRDREASIAALADPANQRYSPERQLGGIRTGPPGARTRSPWPDDEDEDENGMMYQTGAGPFMYSNLNGVGPPTQTMQITQAIPTPMTRAEYTAARASSRSPSPKLDPIGPPSAGTSTRLPYLTRRSDSVSPVPSANAAGPPATSAGYVPPGSVGNVSSGNGSGSGDTAVPNAPTPTPPSPRPGPPPLETVYPPAYEQFAENSPRIGVAYEPPPVQHTHQVTVGLLDVQGYDVPRASEDVPGGVTNASVVSRSIYSQDGSEEWVDHDTTMFRDQDQRIDPLMRIRGALVSAASVGPRDHEDYMRRVTAPIPAPSAGSHSQSHSHSTH